MKQGRPILLQKPKAPRRKRGLLIILITLMLLVAAVAVSVNLIATFNSFHNQAEWAQALCLQGSGPEVIYLLYGIDYWGASPYVERLLLLHHDTGSGAMTAVYIPGNTMIKTEEGDPEPLGQLYRRLPAEEFIRLVQGITGLPVHHFVELNYEGIAAMTEYLDGIEAQLLPGGPPEELLPEDKEVLGGFELYRYFLTADHGEPVWDQLERQRQVLLQLWNKMERCKFWQWPRLARLLNTFIDTDLSWRELGELRHFLAGYSFSQVKTAVLPGKEEMINGCSLWVPDAEAVTDLVRMINEGYLVLPGDVRVEVLNGTGISGVAAEVSALLEREGFQVTPPGNADHFEYEETLVIARGESLAKARAVALHIAGAVLEHRPDAEAEVDVSVIVGQSYLQAQEGE